MWLLTNYTFSLDRLEAQGGDVALDKLHLQSGQVGATLLGDVNSSKCTCLYLEGQCNRVEGQDTGVTGQLK